MSASPFLPREQFVGLWLRGAVPADLCAGLIEHLEARHFEPTGRGYPRGYRDNDRLVFDDPSLASWLLELTSGGLPKTLTLAGQSWKLAGLNPRFRACRYRDGQAFCVHRDGPYVPSEDTRSWLTLQLYLNERTFTGGRTRFYSDASAQQLWAALEPEAGSAIVFDHRAWHDGEAVTGGTKYVLRTDVLFERAASPRAEARQELGRHRGYVWCARGCRDGSVVSAGRDGTVRRWREGGAVEVHEVEAGSVMSLAEASDGRLWFGTRSGRVGVVDGPAREVSAAVLRVEAHQHGVAATTAAGEVLVVEASGAVRWRRAVHEGWVWGLASDGEAVISGAEDGRVVRTSGNSAPVELLKLGCGVRALARSSDGTLLVGDSAGWVHRLAPGGEVTRFRAHEAAITSIAVVPDGQLATGSEDARVRCWRADQLLTELHSTDFVTSVDFTPEGALLWAGYEGGVTLVTRPSP